MGLVLLAFGVLGLINRIGFFSTGGATVAGLNTNGALSVLSICVGLLLFIGMVIGGNFASTLNMVLGIAFILSGFVNLALLETDYNFLAFQIQNVLFSFVVGLMLMVFGMYGRVSGGLPHDNPYWRARHPEEAEQEMRLSRRATTQPMPVVRRSSWARRSRLAWGHASLRIPLPLLRRHVRTQPPDGPVLRPGLLPRRALRHREAALHRGRRRVVRQVRSRRSVGRWRRGRLLRRGLLRLRAGGPGPSGATARACSALIRRTGSNACGRGSGRRTRSAARCPSADRRPHGR